MARQTNNKEIATARMIALFVKFFMVPLPKILFILLPCPSEDKTENKNYTPCHLLQFLACVASVPKKLPHQKVIGEAIRKHRKADKMSREKLTKKANLHPAYCGQVERGEQAVSVHALARIAKALGVRFRDLVASV